MPVAVPFPIASLPFVADEITPEKVAVSPVTVFSVSFLVPKTTDEPAAPVREAAVTSKLFRSRVVLASSTKRLAAGKADALPMVSVLELAD